jgi:hypothetical protein
MLLSSADPPTYPPPPKQHPLQVLFSGGRCHSCQCAAACTSLLPHNPPFAGCPILTISPGPRLEQPLCSPALIPSSCFNFSPFCFLGLGRADLSAAISLAVMLCTRARACCCCCCCCCCCGLAPAAAPTAVACCCCCCSLGWLLRGRSSEGSRGCGASSARLAVAASCFAALGLSGKPSISRLAVNQSITVSLHTLTHAPDMVSRCCALRICRYKCMAAFYQVVMQERSYANQHPCIAQKPERTNTTWAYTAVQPRFTCAPQ